MAVCVDSLTVGYGEHTVLWNVSFTVPKGKLVGIIGPNGAGKSSLLKAAIGLVRPISGSVSFLGKKHVAYVPQREMIDWDFPITAFEVALMGRYGKLGMLKWASKADRDTTMQMLRMLGIEDLANRQIGELSGGQQQRLFIARALMQDDAEVFLLDEPFAGVDIASEKEIMKVLKTLRDKGKTILVVHHNPATVEDYFDEVAILSTSLVAYGPVDRVFTDKNIAAAYGGQSGLLEEAKALSNRIATGKVT